MALVQPSTYQFAPTPELKAPSGIKFIYYTLLIDVHMTASFEEDGFLQAPSRAPGVAATNAWAEPTESRPETSFTRTTGSMHIADVDEDEDWA